MHLTDAGRFATKVRPGEFRKAMNSLGAFTNQDMARLLHCGEATISRLLNDRQNLSEHLFSCLAVKLGPEGLFKICDFGNEEIREAA